MYFFNESSQCLSFYTRPMFGYRDQVDAGEHAETESRKMEADAIWESTVIRRFRITLLDGVKLSSSSCIKSFKELLDPALLLEEQVSVAVKSAFYHLNMVCRLLHILDFADLSKHL